MLHTLGYVRARTGACLKAPTTGDECMKIYLKKSLLCYAERLATLVRGSTVLDG